MDLEKRLAQLQQDETNAFAIWHFMRGRVEECAAIMALLEKAPSKEGAEVPPEGQ